MVTGGPVGILNLQGDVREHAAALADLGVATRLVKGPADLVGCAGVVLPGGESTTLSMLLLSTGLFDALASALADGLPVLGTCAGLVLLSSEVLDGRSDQRFFGALPCVVRRNGFGRQMQSFETELSLNGPEPDSPLLPAVFIRAPLVVSVGPGVEVLSSLSREGLAEPSPVLIRSGHVLAASFHPELTPDRRVHRMFVNMCGV